MSHPTLGQPPPDLRAGFPDAALRLRHERARLGQRALEIALERDPSMRERHGELGLRKLLRDTEPLIERLAIALAARDTMAVAAWADWVSIIYRRRGVPMDDLVHLCEGLRHAVGSTLAPDEQPLAEEALDEAVKVFRWNRRLAGDARKRNKLLAFIYKGA
ncbi:MAG TPA: hypothetical protein VM344_01805 [Vitreimonas sp.]|nr:hypothetical protein [Vitreimonas sp.]